MTMQTNEGGEQFEHSLDHALEFFSKAGSLMKNKQSFYGNEESALSLFQKVWIVDREIAFRLLLWLRDCRGGAGNRSGFRECLRWLSKTLGGAEWIQSNLDWIPEVGRYDDLRALFDAPLERSAADFWAMKMSVTEDAALAAKWADRKDFPLKHALGYKREGEFRRYLARLRKHSIVEHKMSTHRWNEVDYAGVPSVAMARYTKAFSRHDPERFAQFKTKVKSGEAKVHASVLFPHDCVRTALTGDPEMADAQFNELPNHMGEGERAVVLADTSGSMGVEVSGMIRAVDISQALALYCSAKIPEENPFHKKFIAFQSESKFVDWNGMTFSQAVGNRALFNGAVGATRIDVALDTMLSMAKWWDFPQYLLPTMLIVVSDMQFHAGHKQQGYRLGMGVGGAAGSAVPESEVQKALNRWTEAGYKAPKVVYWNVAGYAGQPDTAYGKDIAMVSGFSPAILKAIFEGKDLTPLGVMKRALEKYEVRRPE